jgi:predicted Ser/Thr protein kinase
MGIGPNNEKVAVKFERHGTRCPQLRHEYKVYRELTGCHGFCQVYHFGQQDNYNVMVMDLLGPSLEDLFNKCNRRFSLKTVLQIADQMLERVDTLHSRHLIHRDIKPANFVIGLGENTANIYCVDFGLSKRYRHPKNLQHIPHRDGRSLTGTPRYASINNHLGIEQSRRDDLESIGYVLIYFLKGSLPWQGLKAKNAQKKYRLILEKKQQVSIAQLCQGCPSQFAEFLAYTRSLKFDAKPDIPYLRKLFRDLYHAQNCGSIPKLWDWDGMDNDYNSTAGSTGQPPVANPAPAVQPSAAAAASGQPGMSHLRPTTAAAVAAPGAMLGVDADMGMGRDMVDDLDDQDFDHGAGMQHGHRPNTAGGLMQSFNKSAMPGGAQQGSWGYPRQTAPEDPNNAARRPHTAHGARAGFPGVPTPGAPTAGMYGAETEDGHVVAGAREMMRYRRNRNEQGGAPLPQGQPIPAYGAAPAANNNWAVYQQAAQSKPGQQMPSQQLQQQQQQAPAQQGGIPLRKGVAPGQLGNWSYGGAPPAGQMMDNRPKSATMSASAGVRPVSGGGMMMGSAQQAQQAPQSWQQQQQAGVMPTNSNTLSYGSLKNRLLPGGNNVASGVPSNTGSMPANVKAAPGVTVTNAGGAVAPTNGSGATGTNKSKLFSLAR